MKKHPAPPLVSVVMPVYNSQAYITEAVESILNQTYSNIEVVIVDDHSTDTTWKIVSALAKKHPQKITAFRQPQNAGPTQATNRAIRHAQGSYIAIMDSDDVSHPERIAAQVAFLEKNPEVVVVGTQATVINQDGEVIGSKQFPTDHEAIYQAYGEVHPIVHPSVMINRKLLKKKELLYVDKYDIHADYYNMFRLLQYGTFANLDKALIFYRVHGKNNSLKRLKRSYWLIVLIRLEAVLSFHYKMSLKAFFIMLLQTAVALATPEFVLKWLYIKIKGFKNVTI